MCVGGGGSMCVRGRRVVCVRGGGWEVVCV